MAQPPETAPPPETAQPLDQAHPSEKVHPAETVLPPAAAHPPEAAYPSETVRAAETEADASGGAGGKVSGHRGGGGAPAHFWVPSTYFAEGFPYSIVNNLAEVFFKEMGASLGAVGLTSLFHLPWNLKFAWAPFVDRLETKKRWLVATQLGCALLLLLLGFFATGPELLAVASALFLVMAVLSATNDVAIDGYYMEALDAAGQSKFVGYRAMAYKVSSLLVRGPLLALVGVVGWGLGLYAMAAILVLLAVVHAMSLPAAERVEHRLKDALSARTWFGIALATVGMAGVAWAGRVTGVFAVLAAAVEGALSGLPVVRDISLAGWIAILLLLSLLVLLAFLPRLRRRYENSDSYYAKAFVQFLATPRVGAILAFVILFRAGESFLQKMKWPFLSDRLGITLGEYAFANGTVGVAASFVATFLGGALIARHGLRRWLWPFLIAQNGLNLLYVALAAVPSLSEGGARADMALSLVTFVIACEEFGAGLGTAVFMIYLMRLCHPQHRAAHFAILTALMSLSFTFAGSLSGFIAQAIGYTGYFAFTFLATIPMMLLATRTPHLD